MNGIIIVDKPEGWTSHDVVAKLRGVLKEKRIGHGGTLDPMATGVLPIFIGRATRAAQFCENAEKEYLATLRPGIVTDTQDITGNILQSHDKSVGSNELIRILPGFIGVCEQLPPMYSAVKIGGKKLYELARRGVTIERPAREIFIRELEFCGMSGSDFLLRVTCSKGTYIRTLCHDIGQELGCGAVMSSLRRVRAGVFTEYEATELSEIIKHAESGDINAVLRPTDTLFTDYPAVFLSGDDVKRCKNGVRISVPDLPDGRKRVYAETGEFLMLGEALSGVLVTVKSFFEVNTSSGGAL